MDVLLNAQVSVPLTQIAALLILGTIIILWGKFRIALILMYLFLFFWGYLLTDSIDFVKAIDDMNLETAAVYYGFGILIAVFVVIGMLKSND
ncbi:MAG TPA: hypothetical protein ENN35_08890 [Deltaproteobacteria bacterium]|nr:hypothetical protein [Deltaproteobacteria bacterium]